MKAMAKPPDPFVENLLELMEPLGDVTARRMFGGYGIYHGEIMFGLVAYSVFYLKVDDLNRGEFEDHGMPPFQFERGDGKVIQMSYYQCPDEALSRPDALRPWAESALEASRRNYRPKRRRKSQKNT